MVEAVPRSRRRPWLGRPHRAWQGLNLHQQLIILFAVLGLLPLSLSNLWSFGQSRRHLARLASQNIRNVAALAAAQIGTGVEQKRSFLGSVVAGNEHLFDLMRRADGDEAGPLVTDALARHLDARAQGGEALEELWVLGVGGRPLVSARGERPPAWEETSPVCVSLADASPAQVAVVAPDLTGPFGPSLLGATSITDTEGRRLGVLCARFRLDAAHHALLQAHREGAAGASLFLLDGLGTALSSVDLPGGPVLGALSLRASSAGLPGDGRIHDEAGSDCFAALAPVPGLRGRVLVVMPVAAAFGQIEPIKWQALAVALILVLASAAAIILVARALTRPLKVLAHAAQRAAAGELGTHVPAEGAAELGELAGAFNQMSVALKESKDLLESRIASRTHELQRSRAFVELLLNSIEQTVVVIDRAHRVVTANRAATEVHGADVVGRPLGDLRAECAGAGDNCPTCQTLATGRTASEECPIRLKETQEILSVQTFPVFGTDHQVEAAVRIGRIVTDEKRLQAQLVHQEKMAAFGLLTAGIAHEIGNPLAAIESQLRLTRRVPEPSRVEETFGIVEREVQRINRLLRELVDFSRRRRDEVSLLSVNQVVEDVARLLGHDPRARSVTIALERAEGLPGVRAKEDHMVQVLLNLGINALDAMRGSGTLTFATCLDGADVVLSVRDTGTGVPDEARRHIFEPFFTTKEPGRGTGLGLFVSRGIVAGLGGSLELGGGEGPGALFVVRLPTRIEGGKQEVAA